MKNALMAVFALCSFGAAAQEFPVSEKGEVVYTTTKEIPLSKRNLGNNAVLWVSKVVGSPAKYIQYNDTVSGKMMLPNIETAYEVDGTSTRISYSATIDYKEGKCRLTIYDIKTRAYSSSYPISYPISADRNKSIVDIKAKLAAATSKKDIKDYQVVLTSYTNEVNDLNAIFNRDLDKFNEIMAFKDDF